MQEKEPGRKSQAVALAATSSSASTSADRVVYQVAVVDRLEATLVEIHIKDTVHALR